MFLKTRLQSVLWLISAVTIVLTTQMIYAANDTITIYPEATTSTTQKAAVANLKSGMSSEVGVAMTSVDGGSDFLTVALVGDLEDALLQFGARGYVPVGFDSDVTHFMGDLVARWHFNRTANRMYLEGLVTGHIFDGSAAADGTEASLGASYGYFRKVASDIQLGGSIGADYFLNADVEDARDIKMRQLNSRIALMANFDF